MIGKYPVVHLIGPTMGQEEHFREVERELTLRGYIVFSPVVYDRPTYDEHPDMLNDMCYMKLLMCDQCVVVATDHIGQSTRLRMSQAFEMKKRVYWYNWNTKHFELLSSIQELEAYIK